MSVINLKKGSSLDLSKDGKSLKSISIGVNWGKITKKSGGLFGIGASTSQEAVDLDASVATFDESGKNLDIVYYGRKTGANGSIKHSGDDRSGDSSADDTDNETININLESMPANVKSMVFFLNSFQGHKFDKIPYSRIRVLENGAPLAKFDLSAEDKFAGKTSMILGKAVRSGDIWKFIAIGEASSTSKIDETVNEIKSTYLN